MNKTRPRLKPCPHCGATNPHIEDDKKKNVFVQCVFCLARGPETKTENQAIIWWNARNGNED